MIPFSRRKVEGGMPQQSFDFLGFTFYWGKSQKGIHHTQNQDQWENIEQEACSNGKMGKGQQKQKSTRRTVENILCDCKGQFTFYWGRARSGSVIPKLKTKAKTMRAKLNKVKEWIKELRNREPLRKIWRTFTAKLRGHINYYGVSHNAENVSKFLNEATKIVFKWLNRRSQRKSFTWEQFAKCITTHPLPTVKIVHRLF